METTTTIELKPGSLIVLGKNNRVYRILDVAKDNKSMLVMSVDEKHTFKKPFYEFPQKITYENSTIRKWLNNEFLNNSFTEEERSLIIESTLEDDIQDKVFLLSVEEAKKYFKDDGERVLDGYFWDEGWWLRTSGKEDNCAAYVKNSGSIHVDGVSVFGHNWVRPTLRMNLKFNTFKSKNFEVGNIIKFGKYDWRILDIYEEGVLLITKKAVCGKPYETISNKWKDSSIRRYLNEDFIDEEFDEDYKNAILETKLGVNVTDKVFLLSVEEVKKYFIDDNDWRFPWHSLLRTSGKKDNCVAFVWSNNIIEASGSHVDEFGNICPALRLNLESEILKSKISKHKNILEMTIPNGYFKNNKLDLVHPCAKCISLNSKLKLEDVRRLFHYEPRSHNVLDGDIGYDDLLVSYNNDSKQLIYTESIADTKKYISELSTGKTRPKLTANVRLRAILYCLLYEIANGEIKESFESMISTNPVKAIKAITSYDNPKLLDIVLKLCDNLDEKTAKKIKDTIKKSENVEVSNKINEVDKGIKNNTIKKIKENNSICEDVEIKNGSINLLGKECELLEVNEKEHKILVSPFEAINCNPYSYENSDLRKWLNTDFYNDTFSDEEKSYILDSNLNDGINDKIFLLNMKEMAKYCKNKQLKNKMQTGHDLLQLRDLKEWDLDANYSFNLKHYEFGHRILPIIKVDSKFEIQKEKIIFGNEKWLVLEQNDKYSELMMISNICKPLFNDRPNNWKDCAMRDYLNHEFIDEEFNEEEKKTILETKLGDEIIDKVFLLNANEVEKYLMDDKDRASNVWWWLRTDKPKDSNYNETVGDDKNNSMIHEHNNGHSYGVRPALRINLKSEMFQSVNIECLQTIKFGRNQWLILDFNETERWALIISKDIMRKMAYVFPYKEYKDSVRKYLNHEYLNSSSLKKFKKYILESKDGMKVFQKASIQYMNFRPSFYLDCTKDNGLGLYIKDGKLYYNISRAVFDKSKWIKDYMKLEISDLKGVKWKDGSEVNKDLLRYIILQYANYGCSKLSEYDTVVEKFDKKSLEDAIDVLYNQLAKKYKFWEKDKYNNKVFRFIFRYCSGSTLKEKYSFASKKSIAYKSLLLNDSVTAMRIADKEKRLDEYAKLRNTTAEELKNTVMIDFGLNKDGKKIYDLGTTKVEATLTPDLKVTLVDLNSGKQLRSLPKKYVQEGVYLELSDDLKEFRNNVKYVFKKHADQLLGYYLNGNEIEINKWKEYYLDNPILNKLARLIVWMQDKTTFLLTDSGLVDEMGNTYELTKSNIKVAHNIELSSTVTEHWKEYFVENKLKQPFEQVYEYVQTSNEVAKDRYKGAEVPIKFLMNRKKHGISIRTEREYDYFYFDSIELKDCNLTEKIINDYDAMEDIIFELNEFTYDIYNRQVNHIVYILDRLTVYSRIQKDDVSIEKQLGGFNEAQITDFIELATESKATQVVALLLEYKKEHFKETDFFDDFLLDL